MGEENEFNFNVKGFGRLECLDHAAAVMRWLGDYLFIDDKKVRVTIERDPENGSFTVEREYI